MMVGLPEVGKLYLTPQTLCLFIVHNHELLVGGGIDQEFKTLTDEKCFHAHGCLDGLFGELLIQQGISLLAKQCLKLQSDEGALGNHGTVLFLDGEEVLVRIMMGEDHCLATEGSDLRAADIEDVAVAGEIGQGDIIAFCHESITESCPVDIQRDLVTLADLIDIVELTG